MKCIKPDGNELCIFKAVLKNEGLIYLPKCKLQFFLTCKLLFFACKNTPYSSKFEEIALVRCNLHLQSLTLA